MTTEQISRVECGIRDDDFYCLSPSLPKHGGKITHETADNSKTLALDDELLGCVLDRILALIEEQAQYAPEPSARIARAVLKNGQSKYLPFAELNSILSDAWTDANILMQSIAGTQLMGLVACPTVTPVTGNLPVNAFMGMKMMNPQPQQSVRLDNQTWNCACGQTDLHGNFCPECGSAAPPKYPDRWDCPSCGAKNLTGRFCPECGRPVPLGERM